MLLVLLSVLSLLPDLEIGLSFSLGLYPHDNPYM